MDKPHSWVGAFVMNLSDPTAAVMAEHIREGRRGQPPRIPKKFAVPALIDVYCEHCRMTYDAADRDCTAYLAKRRRTAA